MATTLYPGIPFSPQATLTDNIGAADTIIPVSDVSAFPAAPNLATIGTDEDGETILYAAKTANALSGCQRGVEGTAKAWQMGEIIARNFTAKDHNDLIAKVQEAAKTAEARGVVFADGDTFQEKYDSGDLDGDSAYQLAVNNGFTGTEKEWLSSLKGDPGTPGTDGKTAYQYAVDGGYTGTEAEFQELMGSGPWLPVAGGTMTGKITGVVTPEADADAANKAYVDSKAGNVKAGNVNLLDNWYFPDPVNQRGLTHYVGEGHIYDMYSVDRFQIYNGVSCDLVSGGLKFTFPGYSDAGNYIFGQPLENVPGLRGKTVTLSVLVTDYTGGEQGVWLFGKFHNDYHNSFASSTLQGTGLYSATFLVPDDAEMILVGITSPLIPVTITVMAVKLELGSQQTLAHQNADGSWVLNDPPPNKALELEKCQRYFLKISSEVNAPYYPGFVNGSGYASLFVTVPVTMRKAPSITGSGSHFLMAIGSQSENEGVSSGTVSVIYSNTNVIKLQWNRSMTNLFSIQPIIGTIEGETFLDANL